MAIKKHFEQFRPLSRDEWRAWLETNHATSNGIWLVSNRPGTSQPRLSYAEIVEEALCFGWIDSLKRVLDPERSVQLVTPRKPGSQWSAVNKTRIEQLNAAGRIAPAGHARINAAMQDGSWSLLDTVEALLVPPDLEAALGESPGAAATFAALPPSRRKYFLWWLQSAKRPGTRATRIAAIVTAATLDGELDRPQEE